jgi:Fis family transcriptional regulator
MALTEPNTVNNEDTGQTSCAGVDLIAKAVTQAVDRYIRELDGEMPLSVYDMVIQAVEKPLFETVLRHTRGNQSQAAMVLGLNRGTFRKRMRQAGIEL